MSRIEQLPEDLDSATAAQDIDQPGYRLHTLQGDLKDHCEPEDRPPMFAGRGKSAFRTDGRSGQTGSGSCTESSVTTKSGLLGSHSPETA